MRPMRPRYFLILISVPVLLAGVYAWNIEKALPNRLAVATEPFSSADGAGRPGTQAAVSVDPPGRAGGEGGAGATFPQVVVAPVAAADVPIFLSGIGTVQAYYTVDAKALVDGVIFNVNFNEGEDVKIGDPLVTIDPTPYAARVAQWQAAKQRAEAQLENAKTNLWRDQQLLAHNFATQKQTDADAELVGQYTADIAQYDAEIKYAQWELDNTVIRSQINGRTGIRHVDPGNLIRAADNTNLVTVVQIQPIYVIITVPAKALAQAGITPGLSDLAAYAYSEDGNTLLDSGKVQTINNVVNQSTGTIKLKASFPNERTKLWPGDFVDCKIVVETRHNGLTVPAAAIQQGPKGTYVWVIGPDNIAEPRGVFVRQTLHDTVLLDRGVQPNEKVVVEGQFHLHAGAQVSIVPQLMANDSESSEVNGPAAKE
jgi:membrane fusion protein, multidrug efflux system